MDSVPSNFFTFFLTYLFDNKNVEEKNNKEGWKKKPRIGYVWTDQETNNDRKILQAHVKWDLCCIRIELPRKKKICSFLSNLNQFLDDDVAKQLKVTFTILLIFSYSAIRRSKYLPDLSNYKSRRKEVCNDWNQTNFYEKKEYDFSVSCVFFSTFY